MTRRQEYSHQTALDPEFANVTYQPTFFADGTPVTYYDARTLDFIPLQLPENVLLYLRQKKANYISIPVGAGNAAQREQLQISPSSNGTFVATPNIASSDIEVISIESLLKEYSRAKGEMWRTTQTTRLAPAAPVSPQNPDFQLTAPGPTLSANLNGRVDDETGATTTQNGLKERSTGKKGAFMEFFLNPELIPSRFVPVTWGDSGQPIQLPNDDEYKGTSLELPLQLPIFMTKDGAPEQFVLKVPALRKGKVQDFRFILHKDEQNQRFVAVGHLPDGTNTIQSPDGTTYKAAVVTFASILEKFQRIK